MVINYNIPQIEETVAALRTLQTELDKSELVASPDGTGLGAVYKDINSMLAKLCEAQNLLKTLIVDTSIVLNNAKQTIDVVDVNIGDGFTTTA